MPKVGETELLRWRTLPASQLLPQLATHAKRDITFLPIKGQGTERWHVNVDGRDYELITDGPKFFDTRAQRGGGGGVDLVMHLYRLDFKAATDALRRLKI